MPDSLSLISPAQRQRLQKLWEEARGAIARASSPPSRPDAERIHDLLADCVAGDPGNTVYLDALLMNLRHWRSHSKPWWWFWIPGWISDGSNDFPDPGWDPNSVKIEMRCLKFCKADKSLVNFLLSFAEKCEDIDAPETEIRYLQEALHYEPDSEAILVKVGRSLLRQGRFDEARSSLERLGEAASKSSEVAELLVILDSPSSAVAPRKGVLSRSESRHCAADYLALAAEHVELRLFDEAEAAAAKALSLSGGDLSIREKVEEVSLARLKNNVAIARRLVEHEPSEAHQQTLRRWVEELGRLELATLHARSERFPQDAGLKLEVAIRLKRAGNYSGAIQRLEEIPPGSSQRPAGLIELGECWQHLRQFEKALDFYREAVGAAEDSNQTEPLNLGLYRAGCLAAAMKQNEEAHSWLQRLAARDPDFKDVRQRLREIPAE